MALLPLLLEFGRRSDNASGCTGQGHGPWFKKTAVSAVLGLSLALQAQVGFAREGDPDYHLLLYVARMADSRLVGDILMDQSADYLDSWLIKVAPGVTLGSWPGDSLRWELEGQVVKHGGVQSHWELNTAVLARWIRFPWDHVLNTSIAIGEGVSWASTRPPLELEGDGETRSLLNYILVELTVAPPGNSRWELVGRIHHRSGVFGLFGVSGGSNALGAGVRWRF